MCNGSNLPPLAAFAGTKAEAHARALLIAAVFFTMTPLLISIQWLLGKLGLPGWGFICSNYYRLLCALLRIHVRVVGEPTRARAVLYVSNHVSWVDIVVIGSVTPVAFVAKREVASGRWSASPPRCSARCSSIAPAASRLARRSSEIVARLASGTSVVLFAEGTSSDGNRVLPFRSALLGAVERAAAQRRTHGDAAAS